MPFYIRINGVKKLCIPRKEGYSNVNPKKCIDCGREPWLCHVFYISDDYNICGNCDLRRGPKNLIIHDLDPYDFGHQSLFERAKKAIERIFKNGKNL